MATHLTAEVWRHEQDLGVHLFVLVEVHLSHGYLVIDEIGKTYLLSDELIPFANSFAGTLEKFIRGLLPDFEHVA